MKSLYQFIVKPKNKRYDNIRKFNDKELIINTNIESHNFVSKEAEVVEVPLAYETKINKGDTLYIHHNIFRRWYDIRGKEQNSTTYFKDDLYFCWPEQIYMYNLKAHLDYCFVKPIENKNYLSTSKEQLHFGVLKYSNKYLEKQGIKLGDLVIFTPNCEFEFIINNERLYCMKSNQIALTNEYQGNEKEYNPSWA